MQVEEEEEANGESDDHATYTIEDQYASRRRQTSMPMSSDGQNVGRKNRRSRIRSAPQPDRGKCVGDIDLGSSITGGQQRQII